MKTKSVPYIYGTLKNIEKEVDPAPIRNGLSAKKFHIFRVDRTRQDAFNDGQFFNFGQLVRGGGGSKVKTFKVP